MAWPRKNYKPLGDDLTAINKAALGYLSRREYSVAELTAKLRERGADESVLDESIRRLQELHYEFGFGNKRLQKLITGFSEKAVAFDSGAYDMEDLRSALKEDTGIELKITWCKDEKA